MDTSDFEPSKLGTKTHWNSVYEKEVANFEETGDEGEIWFGEDSVERMVDWTLENVPTDTDPRILEIGSGNGTLLFALHEAGYAASSLAGFDYSPDAVKLARMVARSRESEEIAFYVCDFLSETPPPPSGKTDSLSAWDALLDKGTYDAIALGDKDKDGRSPVAAYPVRASRLVKDDGYFLITSCNFTEEELKTSFVNSETNFQFHSRVKHPSISFGGKTGSVYTTVAFQKVTA
ncbi:S-adenosyl-L-methionine-dependent methyltransferase [Gloeopeniophorella convolvens]|nr:S-adenosyl-L-methionine-dependent methyltransferase [Gloeopeniophorella convolvens]